MAVSQELGDTQLNSGPSTQPAKKNGKRKLNGTMATKSEEGESPPKRRGSSFPFGQMVTLQIGYSENTRFVAPKHFICAKSERVRTAVELPMERQGKVRVVVYLEQLCPTGFQVYLHWVYRDRIDYTLLDGDADDVDEGCVDDLCSTEWRGNRKSKLMKRIRLYSMAVKLKDSTLQEGIIDDLIAGEFHTQLDDAVIKDCLDRLRGMSSPIVQWMADVYIAKVGGETFSRDTDLPSDFLLFVMERMKARSKNEDLNQYPAWDGRYQYHELKDED